MAFEIQVKYHQKMEFDFIKYLEDFTPDQIDSFMEIMGKVEDYVDTFLRNEAS